MDWSALWPYFIAAEVLWEILAQRTVMVERNTVADLFDWLQQVCSAWAWMGTIFARGQKSRSLIVVGEFGQHLLLSATFFYLKVLTAEACSYLSLLTEGGHAPNCILPKPTFALVFSRSSHVAALCAVHLQYKHLH